MTKRKLLIFKLLVKDPTFHPSGLPEIYLIDNLSSIFEHKFLIDRMFYTEMIRSKLV